jgi:small subunit ribosomal protein S2
LTLWPQIVKLPESNIQYFYFPELMDTGEVKGKMNVAIPSMQDLLSAGVHFGHKVSRGNPRMKNYLFGARDGVHIINLERAEEKLQEAANAAYEYGKEGKSLLIVGTKKQAQEKVKELALKANASYANIRWVGGLLTNFDEIKRNFKKLNELKEQQDKGQLSHYTKKEQLLISKKLEKFGKELGGVSQMEKIPEVVLVIDAITDLTAVKEANKMSLVVIGLCDSNADPTWFNHPVPANDDGIKSINLITETLVNAYCNGQKEAGVRAAAQKAKEEKEQAKKDAAEVASSVDEETAAIEEQVEKQIVKESVSKEGRPQE